MPPDLLLPIERPAAIRRTPVRELLGQLTTLAIDDALTQLKDVQPKVREDEYQKLVLIAMRQRIDTTLEVMG